MKLYKYDNDKLDFVETTKSNSLFLKIILGVVVFVFLLSINTAETPQEIDYETILLIENENKFSEENAIKEIKKYNFRFPHIVYAQAIHEASYKGETFNSNIFTTNHNMFGMKQAQLRLNVASGTQFGHAYYTRGWKDSILDYALWYATYASRCYTEDQLYQLLDKVYAEDTLYVPKLKNIIEQQNLKQLFNERT